MLRFIFACGCEDFAYRCDRYQTDNDIIIRSGNAADATVRQPMAQDLPHDAHGGDTYMVLTPKGAHFVDVYIGGQQMHQFLCKHILATIRTMFFPTSIRVSRDVALDDDVLAETGEWSIVKVGDQLSLEETR